MERYIFRLNNYFRQILFLCLNSKILTSLKWNTVSHRAIQETATQKRDRLKRFDKQVNKGKVSYVQHKNLFNCKIIHRPRVSLTMNTVKFND